MSSSGGDRGEVKPRHLLVGSGPGRDPGRRLGSVEVAFGDGMNGDQVRHIDDAAYQVMIELVALAQPGPPSGPKFVERLPGHQPQYSSEIVDAVPPQS